MAVCPPIYMSATGELSTPREVCRSGRFAVKDTERECLTTPLSICKSRKGAVKIVHLKDVGADSSAPVASRVSWMALHPAASSRLRAARCESGSINLHSVLAVAVVVYKGAKYQDIREEKQGTARQRFADSTTHSDPSHQAILPANHPSRDPGRVTSRQLATPATAGMV
ncbi:hypothetical protein Bbelb_109730 [Branchiostoma belcheri]|nr:hypothetical protein Bbelb_109730 [Branchiostoma belcheri]